MTIDNTVKSGSIRLFMVVQSGDIREAVSIRDMLDNAAPDYYITCWEKVAWGPHFIHAADHPRELDLSFAEKHGRTVFVYPTTPKLKAYCLEEHEYTPYYVNYSGRAELDLAALYEWIAQKNGMTATIQAEFRKEVANALTSIMEVEKVSTDEELARKLGISRRKLEGIRLYGCLCDIYDIYPDAGKIILNNNNQGERYARIYKQFHRSCGLQNRKP